MSLTLKPRAEGGPAPIFASALLYGPAKTSKSTAACAIPGGILYVNADTPNALHHAFKRHNADGRIQEVDLSGGVLQALLDLGYAIEDQAARPLEQRVFDTVVVDPLGELYRQMLEEESDRAVRPTLPQYGNVSTYLERFCRMLVESPIHVVFICHEQAVKDESTGAFERLPWTGTSNPALGSKLMGMVDIVSYTGVRQGEDGGRTYVGQLVSDFGRRGGDRFDALDDGRGYRELDLGEWFRTCGVYLSADAATNDDDGADEAQEAA